MIRTPFIAPLIAAVALAGCDTGNTVVLNPDGTEVNEAQERAVNNVQLPPSIVDSDQFRCKDNSLVSVDWLSDGTRNSARVTPEGGSAVTLTQTEAGGPFTAEGASLTGEAQAESVTYNGQSCSS
ncbi:MAG: hypothetical protein H0U34_00145 [Sphingomonas sp.]|nr:hypothetical protein [Sphingomonas sp.]